MVQQLYENLATQGVIIIADLLKDLADVDSALAGLYGVLTKDNIQESLVVGQDKYKGVPQVKEKVSRWCLFWCLILISWWLF